MDQTPTCACGYSLVGLGPTASCPECGRGAGGRRTRGLRDLEKPLGIIAPAGTGLALLPFAAIHLVYVVAWIELGRRPIPHVDDPSLGVVSAVAATLARLTLFALPIGLHVLLLSLLACVIWPRRARVLLTLGWIALGAGLAYVSIRHDPLGALNWFAD